MIDPGVIAALDDMLDRYNIEQTKIADAASLAIFVHSESGELHGGIHGFTWGGYCEIKTLFVAAGHRGQGIGAALLRSAEQEAVARGCTRIILSTHGFQAPLFYERHGFQRVATIEHCPRDDAYILLMKPLA